MSDVAALLQPLKDRLAAATPGPWGTLADSYRSIPMHRIGSDITGSDVAQVILHGSQEVANAALIAAAPMDQAKLIAAIEAVVKYVKDTKATGYRVDGDYVSWAIAKALRGDAE